MCDVTIQEQWATTKSLADAAKSALGAREVVLVAVFDGNHSMSRGTDAPSRAMQRALRGVASTPVPRGRGAKKGDAT